MNRASLIRSVVVVAMTFVTVVTPTVVLGGKPSGTSTLQTAVAYFQSPDASSCAILNVSQGMYRQVGSSEWRYGQSFDVQLGDGGCNTSAAAGAELDASQYRVIPLSAAFVVGSIEVAGQTVDVDVSWVAVGTPTYASEQNDGWSFVGKEVGAHLTGTISVDGLAWIAQQDNAILRDFAIGKNF